MKKLLLIPALLSCIAASAQSDTTTSIDQLQVPSSPAFNMLGISPDNIERPQNPTDFALSLGNATSGFTTIPKDYAVEFAPFWVFAKKQATYKDFISNNPGKNILQTATVSAATSTGLSPVDSSEFRKMAVALKFSIFRGHVSDDFKKWNDSVSIYLHTASETLVSTAFEIRQNDSLMKVYLSALQSATSATERKRWEDSMTARGNVLDQMANSKTNQQIATEIAILKDLASRTDFKRYGFKLDVAVGTAFDYPDSTFQNCYVSKLSGWITAGWEYPEANFLMVARYSENFNHLLRNNDGVLVKDINVGSLDFGGRLYKDFTSKFTISCEYIKRVAIFNATTLDKYNVAHPTTTDRYTLSLNYKVGKNKNLSFVYGKDFDNVYTKQGNLVAALNFLVGLGSVRPFGGR